MANTIKFTNTRILNSKENIIAPDQDGYYTLVIGGLNIYNTAGDYYEYEGSRELFEKSSAFMRRVQRGALRGEVGHPKYTPGMANDEYVNRIMNIDETNVCAHFSDVWLDFDKVKNKDGTPTIAIMGKVKPSGPKASALESSLNNPKENVCFSIRAISAEFYERGETIRVLKTIVTFDYVNEPGIAIAEKYNSPALENLSEHIVLKADFIRAMDSSKSSLVATESSKEIASDIFKVMGWDIPAGVVPAYTKW